MPQTPDIVLKDTFDVTITINEEFDVILKDPNSIEVLSVDKNYIVQHVSEISVVNMVN
jgi:hypothetical protein